MNDRDRWKHLSFLMHLYLWCCDEVHNYISVNPLNAESMLKDLSRQTAMLVKNIEMVKGEKAG